MLRAYGPGCDGSIVEAKSGRIPEGATWIDLEQPTHEEEKLVERSVGFNIPTQPELTEIEPSSRLFQRSDVLYMTVSVLCGVTEGDPSTVPIGFVLGGNQLVTIRYGTPKPIRAFTEHVEREPDLARNAMTVLVRLLDAIIDRLADELENLGDELEQVSAHVFARTREERRIPATRLTALLTRIGRAQTLLAKSRYSAVSASRMLTFLGGSDRLFEAQNNGDKHHIASLITDVTSLSEHADFLADNLNFLLNAALGLISIEQNAAMKLFSWAALIFLPPTLIAGVYGMNFDILPELHWRYGYVWAWGLILASAILPIWFLKKRGWI